MKISILLLSAMCCVPMVAQNTAQPSAPKTDAATELTLKDIDIAYLQMQLQIAQEAQQMQMHMEPIRANLNAAIQRAREQQHVPANYEYDFNQRKFVKPAPPQQVQPQGKPPLPKPPSEQVAPRGTPANVPQN